MSVGNLKTSGQKGTNWTWQYRMLQGIQKLIDTIAGASASTTNTARMIRITGSTTITNAVKSISCYNAHATATATIAIGGAGAINLLAGETVNFDAGGGSNTFPANYFVINGTGADVLTITVL